MSIVLSKIIIYPIKSLGGILLESSEVTERGLKYDRRYMLVDDNNKFITIRQHPEFLFYKLEIGENGFEIGHKDKTDRLTIPLLIESGDLIKVKVWSDEVDALLASDNINSWFTDQLGFSCRLVYIPDDSERLVEPERVSGNKNVSFADEYPMLIVGQNSIEDLNAKIEEEITYDRFRPNMVFEGGEAYDEFLWNRISIGSAELQCIKPCTRCIVITMNPQTAEVGKEPLKTLFKQRIDDKMVFGENTVTIKDGVVKVGDVIDVKSVKKSPYEKV